MVTSILDHELMINVKRVILVDEGWIPTGALRDVAHAPFDFTSPRRIGHDIDQDDEQERVDSCTTRRCHNGRKSHG